MKRRQRARLDCHGVAVEERRLARLEGGPSGLEAIRFHEGKPLPCRGLFFVPAWRQHADFARQLGCALDEHGLVAVSPDGATDVPGVYAAGDTSGGLQLAAVAAAEGARAAVAITARLLKEDLAAREKGRAVARPSPRAGGG